MAHWKKFGIASGKAAWKAGAFLLKWGAKPAAKGSVWTIKKVAVDPAAKKIVNWSLVEKGLGAKHKIQEMRELIKNGQCANCGKKTSTGFFGGQDDVCSASCAQAMAIAYNEVKEVKVPDTETDSNSLYLACGCNRLNMFHGSRCIANKANERVAQNVKWSEKDPRYMKATGATPPGKPALTAEQRKRAEIQENIRNNPPKKKWHGGY